MWNFLTSTYDQALRLFDLKQRRTMADSASMTIRQAAQSMQNNIVYKRKDGKLYKLLNEKFHVAVFLRGARVFGDGFCEEVDPSTYEGKTPERPFNKPYSRRIRP